MAGKRQRAPTCYCGAPARLKRSQFGAFWSCSRWPECSGLVGCHPGTTRPLGTLAPPLVRTARHRAHEAFDGLRAQVPGAKRRAAYRWLAERLGVHEHDAHMGLMDAETARRVVAICTAPDAAASLSDYVAPR